MKKETGIAKRRRLINEAKLSELVIIGHKGDKDALQELATSKSEARGLSYDPESRGCVKGSKRNGVKNA